MPDATAVSTALVPHPTGFLHPTRSRSSFRRGLGTLVHDCRRQPQLHRSTRLRRECAISVVGSHGACPDGGRALRPDRALGRREGAGLKRSNPELRARCTRAVRLDRHRHGDRCVARLGSAAGASAACGLNESVVSSDITLTAPSRPAGHLRASTATTRSRRRQQRWRRDHGGADPRLL